MWVCFNVHTEHVHGILLWQAKGKEWRLRNKANYHLFLVIHRVHNINSEIRANQSYGHPLKPDCPYKGGSTVAGCCWLVPSYHIFDLITS